MDISSEDDIEAICGKELGERDGAGCLSKAKEEPSSKSSESDLNIFT